MPWAIKNKSYDRKFWKKDSATVSELRLSYEL